MNETKKALKIYGLDEKEIVVYLHLLSRVESSAYKIAKELHIPRSTIYEKLKSLEEKQIVVSSRINNVKHYTPESLNSFLTNLDEKRTVMENVIPRLKEISKNAELQKPQVRFYIGKKGMKLVWEEILETYKYSRIKELFTTSHSNIYQIFPKYFNNWTKRRVETNTYANIMLPRNDSHPEEEPYKRTYRFIEEKYLTESEILTFGDKTGIFVLNEKNPKNYCHRIKRSYRYVQSPLAVYVGSFGKIDLDFSER